MFETYTPGFSNELFRSQLLKSDAGLTGGGPAYVDIMPGQALPYDGEPMDQPGMVLGAQAAQPPSILPSPSAPPMMSAPASYVPGFSPMLLNQAVSAQPERVSMLPFAPEAPPPMAQPSMPSGLGARQNLIDQGDVFMGDTPERFSRADAASNTLANAPKYDPATGFFLDAQGRPGLQFMTDRNRNAGYGKGNTGFLTADPNTQYRMFDERGKNRIVAEGAGMDALQNIYNLANQFNKEQGKKANWGIERLNPATGQWERVAENDPSKNIAGKIADIALPVAASFIPGVGPVLGAALGSAASSAAQGRSLKNTLLRAGLSAATAGAMQATGADKAISGALGKVFAPAAAEATKTGAQKAAEAGLNEIIISGSRSALPSIISSGVGGSLSSVLPGMAPGKGADFADSVFKEPTTPAVQVPSPLDTVAGAPIVVTNTGGGALPIAAAGAGALAQPGVDAAINSIKQQIEQKQAEPEPENEIVVRPTDTFDEAFAPFAPPNVGTLNVPEDEIVVTASGKAPTSFDKQPAAPLAPTLPDLTKTPVDVQGPEKSFLDKLKENLSLSDYLRLAGLGIGLLSGGGGGGRGALSTIPRGLFGGSGVFGGSLPRATLPGASTGFAPRPQTTQDWYRYGYGPSQSFFSYVPEGERNLSQAYTGYAHGGMAEGGDTFAVNGPGTGRSDEIPAMLSDGEYVIDAETVALLGDGSSKAGAERLDQFRINVRRDKGRKLAKGEFSANAKRPEHYLKGGRA